MKQIFYILIISVLMTSCATILNRPYKNITVHTTEQSNIIFEDEKINMTDDKVHFRVKRKEAPLTITIVTDSLKKSVEIESKKSSAFWLNIPFNLGLGMLIDMKNPKRYTYPGKVFINSSDTKDEYSLFGKANNKGELYLHLSLTPINIFQMKPQNRGVRNVLGHPNYSLGLDYYHSKNQFINLSSFLTLIEGSTTTSIPNPPEPIKKLTETETMSSYYFSISNNYKIRQFSFGYGLSFARNTWKSKKTAFGVPWFFGIALPLTIDEYRKTYNAFGLVFPSYIQFGEYFNLGVIYRPIFYSQNMPNKFTYEHMINIELAWKIRLKK